METFEHAGRKYISINGKDYFLLRGYRKNRDRFIFVQVFGRTPLHKEDLPSKDWEVFRTKSGGELVWTAYRKKYFKYDTEAADPALVFIGASSQGSFFIALSNICKRFNFDMNNNALNRIALLYSIGEWKSGHLETINDEGNSGVDAVLVSFDRFFEEENARKVMAEGGNDNE